MDIYVNLGSAFYDKEDFENALTVYRSALDLDPNNAKIHCNLGFLYWGKGDIDEAIKEYELAIENDPMYDIAYNNLGVIYLDDLGRVQKSIELFKNQSNVIQIMRLHISTWQEQLQSLATKLKPLSYIKLHKILTRLQTKLILKILQTKLTACSNHNFRL